MWLRPGQPSIIVQSPPAIPESLLAMAGRDSRDLISGFCLFRRGAAGLRLSRRPSPEVAMASIKVFDPVSVPLCVLEELQRLGAQLEQLRRENEHLRQENGRLQRE